MWFWSTVALSGFLGSEAALGRKPVQAALFKALAFACLLFAAVTVESLPSLLLFAISAGLIFGAVADIAFFVRRRLKLSYLAFIVSQLFYSSAFWFQVEGPILLWLPALLFAIAIVSFLLLLPRIDSTLFPTAITGFVAVQLACAAGEVWRVSPNCADLLGFLGCLLMPITVTLLSLRSQKASIWQDHRLVSSLFLMANALIVASVLN
ncbi:lysoplasmalogenase family protein [Vibrio agarivorans]|uniref:lysoplasmalogenase family protein n=1 Tax=Vibrio agarivorans TaxID=153622 RepID=UPI0025B3C7BB|nr:lysoplasmalogenase family protein [Vibrio agarivorans]MDN3661882.1 lysoplasmalogenase family protein [Vibrio agarivorans]